MSVSLSFEVVMRKDLPLFLFDIVTIATNDKLHILPQFCSDCACYLVATATIVYSVDQFQGQFTK